MDRASRRRIRRAVKRCDFEFIRLAPPERAAVLATLARRYPAAVREVASCARLGCPNPHVEGDPFCPFDAAERMELTHPEDA